MAGPLCGIFVQPLMGTLSDRSRNSWGRRRPYIIGGAIGTILSITFLAWVEEVVEILTQHSYADTDGGGFRTAVIASAIIGVYILNISIQPIQMGLRALIIENWPNNQQEQASAWASRMTGMGNVLGYLAGTTDLSKFAPTLFLTQFQGLCLVAAVSLAIGVSTSCIAATEITPAGALLPVGESHQFTSYFRQLSHTWRTMPLKIRRVCQVQFCSWMGWFPFLFYSTT